MKPQRRYPAFYEKILPIALVVIAIAIVVLLVVILGVGTGLLSGS